MRKDRKVRFCKTCGSQFVPTNGKQVFCGKQCRDGWRYIQELRKKELEEQENAEAMKAWHLKEEQELKRCVCRNCFQFTWEKHPTDFCSPGCEAVYNGIRSKRINSKFHKG